MTPAGTTTRTLPPYGDSAISCWPATTPAGMVTRMSRVAAAAGGVAAVAEGGALADGDGGGSDSGGGGDAEGGGAGDGDGDGDGDGGGSDGGGGGDAEGGGGDGGGGDSVGGGDDTALVVGGFNGVASGGVSGTVTNAGLPGMGIAGTDTIVARLGGSEPGTASVEAATTATAAVGGSCASTLAACTACCNSSRLNLPSASESRSVKASRTSCRAQWRGITSLGFSAAAASLVDAFGTVAITVNAAAQNMLWCPPCLWMQRHVCHCYHCHARVFTQRGLGTEAANCSPRAQEPMVPSEHPDTCTARYSYQRAPLVSVARFVGLLCEVK